MIPGQRNPIFTAFEPRSTAGHFTSMDEIIDLHSDAYFMGEALRQARRAWEQDEVPVGAVIVHQGRIIARAANQVEILKDATAHAEMLVTVTTAFVGTGVPSPVLAMGGESIMSLEAF